jgi:hypothetical protein
VHNLEAQCASLRDMAQQNLRERRVEHAFICLRRAALLLEDCIGRPALLSQQRRRLLSALEEVHNSTATVHSLLEERVLQQSRPAAAPAAAPGGGSSSGQGLKAGILPPTHRLPLRRVIVPDNIIGEFAVASNANSSRAPRGIETCAYLFGREARAEEVPGLPPGGPPVLLLTHMVFPPPRGEEPAPSSLRMLRSGTRCSRSPSAYSTSQLPSACTRVTSPLYHLAPPL